MQISPLQGFDAARCAALEAELFVGDNPWTTQDFAAEFANPSTYYVGIRDGEQLVAYCGIGQLGVEDPDFEVHTIGVDPAFQRRGLGRALLAHCIEVVDGCDTTIGGQIFLEVRTDNAPAIALYESFGFAVISTRKNYYQPSGADAFVMRRGRNEA